MVYKLQSVSYSVRASLHAADGEQPPRLRVPRCLKLGEPPAGLVVVRQSVGGQHLLLSLLLSQSGLLQRGLLQSGLSSLRVNTVSHVSSVTCLDESKSTVPPRAERILAVPWRHNSLQATHHRNNVS